MWQKIKRKSYPILYIELLDVIYFRDVKTGEIVFAHVNLEFAETMWYSSFSLKLKAPCILPGGF